MCCVPKKSDRFFKKRPLFRGEKNILRQSNEVIEVRGLVHCRGGDPPLAGIKKFFNFVFLSSISPPTWNGSTLTPVKFYKVMFRGVA